VLPVGKYGTFRNGGAVFAVFMSKTRGIRQQKWMALRLG